MPDDFSASILTLGSVPVGGSATGDIETIGDQDWFAVTLVEGNEYSIEIEGFYADSLNSLPDPFLRGIYDSTGLIIPDLENDEFDPETRTSSSTFVATYTGLHFISASAYNLGTGTYTVSVSDLGVFDDYASDTTTLGTVNVGGLPALGEFEFIADSDWFSVDLLEGYRYLFELFGDGTGTWADADNLILAPLRDFNGDVIANSGEIAGLSGGFDGPPTVRSYFEYIPTYSGTHYVDALAYQTFIGRYQLEVTDLGVDFDDYTEGPIAPGLVFVGGAPLSGELEADLDKDWISVDLIAGTTYEINLRGLDTGDGTLEFVNLEYMVDPFGFDIPYAFNGGAVGGNSRLQYLATDTGTHNIAVGSYDGYLGTYEVEVDNLFLFDDYGNNPSTDGDLPINSAVFGGIDYVNDYDFFRVSLTAGTIYQFDMNSLGIVDPYIDGIYSYAWHHFYNYPDNYIPGTDDNDSGPVPFDSRITFTAPTTGDYFISVGSAGFTTGSYSLSLLTVGTATDDYLGNQLTLGTIAPGGLVFGVNETEGDEDWFEITLDAGNVYSFTFMGEDSYLSNFDAPALRIFNQFGALQSGLLVDSSSHNEAYIEYSPTTSGTYYVAVGDDLSTNGTGNYTLSAAMVGVVDDYASDITTTGIFNDGFGPTNSVTGVIEEDGDSDWFAVTLTDGHVYDIQLKGAETGVGTLVDPLFEGVYSDLGVFLGGSNDDDGEGANSFSTFEAEYTGVHYFAASSFVGGGSNTGSYTLQYDDLGPYSPNNLLTQTVNEGTIFGTSFTLEDVGFEQDVVVDWDIPSVLFSGSAEALDYSFSSTVDDELTISFSALDDDLVEDDETVIIDALGYVDWVGPPGLGGGAFHTNIDGMSIFGQLRRTLVEVELIFTINSAPEGTPTDIVDYEFTGVEIIGNVLTNFTDGSGESFTATPILFSGPITGELLANGDLQITDAFAAPGTSIDLGFEVIDTRGASTLSMQTIVFADETDDFLPGSTASVYGALEVDAPSFGTIEELGDRDRFRVTLDADEIYQLTLDSDDGEFDPLHNPEIIGVFDGTGALVAGSSDNDSGTGLNALVSGFTVPTDGVYEVEVAGAGDLFTGDYELNATVLGFIDDYLPGTFASTLGTIAPGQTMTGRLETETDLDRFSADLVAGHTYAVSANQDFSGGDPLADPDIIGIYDSTGALLPGTTDTRGGFVGFVHSFLIEEDGTYEIEIGSFLGGFAGDYEVILETFDDYLPSAGADLSATSFGSIGVNEVTIASIDFDGDVDRFMTTLTAGDYYSLSVTGNTSFGDPSLIGVFDDLDQFVPGTADGDDDPVLDGRVPMFTVPTTGDYYIDVGSHVPQGGEYTLELLKIGTEDDFLPGDFASVLGSIDVGSTETGILETQGDLDRFEVTLEAGLLYTISLEGSNTGGGSLTDPALLGVYDDLDQLVADSTDDNSGSGFNALLSGFNVVADGTYQIEVGSLMEGDIGSYSISVTANGPSVILGTPGDDSNETTLIGTPFDDIYQALAGDDWIRPSNGNDTLDGGDGYDVAMYNVAGLLNGVIINNTEIAIGSVDPFSVDKGPAGTDSLISIENFHGTDFDDVIHVGGSGGSYVFDRGGDDIVHAPLGDELTGGTIFLAGSGNDQYFGSVRSDRLNFEGDPFDSQGAPFQGVVVDLANGTAIDGWGDQDSLSSIERVDGTDFADSIVGNESENEFRGLAGDDTFDGAAGNDNINPGEGLDVITGGTGDDRIIGTLSELDGDTITDLIATDCIVLLNELGDVIAADMAITGTTLTIDTDGDGQAEATMTVTNGFIGPVKSEGGRITPLDDFLPGDFVTTFGEITIDSSAAGVIEAEGDRDRFDVILQAGVEYNISLEGVATGAGSLVDPELYGLFDDTGTLVSGTTDADGGVGANALIEGLVLASDGTYQIEVGSAGDAGTGDYELNVEFVRYLDDFLPGISAGFGSISLGVPASGELEAPGDTDRFTVSLSAGTTYQINLLGADTSDGTLPDPFLAGVFALDGTGPFSQSVDDDSGVGLNSLSNFTPDVSGDYLIEVAGFDGDTGTYTLTIDDLGLLDDYNADTATLGHVPVDGSSTGSIDFPNDTDWFSADLSAGRLYRIELLPEDGEGALSDPYFRGVFDSEGVLVPNTENDDGGEGSGSSLLFSTEESGRYYLSAGGFLEDIGQYRLVLSDLGGVVDNDSFNITLNYEGPDRYREGFEQAAARWETVITGDLPFASVEGYGFVDDILIDVNLTPEALEFPNVEQTIFAVSGYNELRADDGQNGANLPTHSFVIVNSDLADRAFFNIDDLAANAIGRALGFGILWEDFGLVENNDGTFTYTGNNALREFSELFGIPNGTALLEDGGSGGLAGQYWSEFVLVSELMTPSVGFRTNNPRPDGVIDNKLSAITVGAMEDLGYQVNYDAADPYSLPNSTGRSSAPSIQSTTTPVADQLVAGVAEGYDTVPSGLVYTYVRPNTLSETPTSLSLNSTNTGFISADGSSALFLEFVTGDTLLVDLTGTFVKNDPTSVDGLSGTVDQADVFSQSGSLLLSLDFSSKPVQVGDLLNDWPHHDFDDENIIIVDASSDTTIRINPNGGESDANRIFTGESDDFVRGGSASELIDGGPDNDTLLGEMGDDTLIGGSGNDVLDGGEGRDLAVYSGEPHAYTLTLSPMGTEIEDRRIGGDGTDDLIDVELIDFATDLFSGPFDLAVFGGPTSLSAEDFQSFIELYIAYFNRAPDAVGLNFWGTTFANGLTLDQMASEFVGQPETQATYPAGTSNETFAETVYNNVLGRTPDLLGFNFWVSQLENGNVSRDAFILEVLKGAKAELDFSQGQDFVDQQIADRAYLANKTDLGTYFAVNKGMSDVSNASAAMAEFDGTPDSITAAVAAIDGYYQDALDPVSGEFLMPVVGVLDDPFALA